MKWFEGDIPAAVATSQAKKAVFVVAILGSDEASQGLEQTLESAEVQSVLAKPDKFVCIRIEPDSASHTAFSQLYPGASAASAHFISLNAIKLDTVKAPITPVELKERLESLLEGHARYTNPRVETQVTTPIVGNQNAGGGTAETRNPAESTSISSASATSDSANANVAADSSSNENITFEEKLRRAKELAAAKQLLKQKEEEEEQKRREVERREAGKGMAELKRWQEEQEMKRVLDERKKDKEADKVLRQKLRDQIAADRAARNAKTNAEFLEQKAEQQQEAAPSGPTQRTAFSSNTASNFAGQARLSFRIPDGGSQTHAFDHDSTLGHVRQFLLDNGNLPFRSFSISIAFPRKQFSEEEYGKTLRELGLLPTAALLLLPSSGLSSNRVTSSTGGLWTFITALISYLLYPVNMVWTMVQRALPGPGGAAAGRAAGGNRPNPGTRAPDTDSTSNKTNAAREAATKRQAKRDQSDNVHRLRNADDDDEDNATWNGNSTQQM